MLDRAFGEEEPLGYLPISEPAGDDSRHLLLATG